MIKLPEFPNWNDSSGAVFGTDRTWRYLLWRRWDPTLPEVVFIGLNPSTADETKDDPTIRRCINFAKAWGYGSYIMCNLYGIRSTDPKGIKAVKDPVGLMNDACIQWAANREQCGVVIAAWGAGWWAQSRVDAVTRLVSRWYCLGRTKNGSPRHPLYMRGDATPIPFVK